MTAFDDVQLYPAGEIVGEAQVFGGALTHVSLKVKDRVELLLPKDGRDKLKARIIYKGPLDAPVADNRQVGVLQLELNGSILRDVPVLRCNLSRKEASRSVPWGRNGTFHRLAAEISLACVTCIPGST